MFEQIDNNTIRVNLDAPPMLPFDQATISTNNGDGWVTVQKRANRLYVDGHKVIMHLPELRSHMYGYDLLDETTGLPNLHPNILDALWVCPHLIPGAWIRDKKKVPLAVFFMAVKFKGAKNNLLVRSLEFIPSSDGSYYAIPHYAAIGGKIYDRRPAAALLSN
jgi:hypothetical protein